MNSYVNYIHTCCIYIFNVKLFHFKVVIFEKELDIVIIFSEKKGIYVVKGQMVKKLPVMKYTVYVQSSIKILMIAVCGFRVLSK